MKIYKVKWYDAFSLPDDESHSLQDLKQMSDKLIVTTLGYIPLRTKHGIYICSERLNRKYRGITFVPQNLIIEIKESNE